MTRRASALLLLLLAAGLAYGWFVVPLLLAPADIFDEEHIDVELRAQRLEAAGQLAQWLQERPTPAPEVDYKQMIQDLLANARRERANAPSAPTKELRGMVAASTPDGDVVMLDIGSAAGLWAGRSLDVHRPGPVPFLVGTLQVEHAWEHRAVARVVERCPPLRPGDEIRAHHSRSGSIVFIPGNRVAQ